MILGYEKIPIEGRSTKTYPFQADPIGFDFPPVGAVYFAARIIAQSGTRPDIRFIYLGRAADLKKELPQRQLEQLDDNVTPNAILWLRVDESLARSAIQLDLTHFLPADRQDSLLQ